MMAGDDLTPEELKTVRLIIVYHDEIVSIAQDRDVIDALVGKAGRVTYVTDKLHDLVDGIAEKHEADIKRRRFAEKRNLYVGWFGAALIAFFVSGVEMSAGDVLLLVKTFLPVLAGQ